MRTFIRKKNLTGSGTFNEAFENKQSFMKIFRYFDFQTRKETQIVTRGKVKLIQLIYKKIK